MSRKLIVTLLLLVGFAEPGELAKRFYRSMVLLPFRPWIDPVFTGRYLSKFYFTHRSYFC